jgi:hypothetical protein
MEYKLYSSYSIQSIQPIQTVGFIGELSSAFFNAGDNKPRCLILENHLHNEFKFTSPSKLEWLVNISESSSQSVNDTVSKLIALFAPFSIELFLYTNFDQCEYLGLINFCSLQNQFLSLKVAFELVPSLPPSKWLKYKSTTSLILKANGVSYQIDSIDQAKLIIDKFERTLIWEIEATQIQGYTLWIIFNGEHAIGRYRDNEHNTIKETINNKRIQSRRTVTFTGYLDHDWDFEERNIIDKHEAIEIVIEFIESSSTSRMQIIA